MKISNSKKELARIISENGGWFGGTAWAVQNGEHGRISFSGNKPVRHGDKSWMAGGGFQFKIEVCKPLSNWHQCILSREEYFHLYPAPDADGWIEWDGKPKSPVDKGTLVDVKMKDGTCHEAQILDDENWGHFWGDGDIVAYRLHKPELAKSTAVGDDETNLAAKEELEAMEYKPSIEQLAADYRNRKDYADRKRDEADAAKADAEAKLEELVAAGKEIGLVISVGMQIFTTDKPWAVGDGCLIEECSIKPSLEGCSATIKAFDFDDKELPYHVILSGSGDTAWVNRITKQ